MDSETLADYFIETYYETNSLSEFVETVNRETTIHEIRTIESIWHTIYKCIRLYALS